MGIREKVLIAGTCIGEVEWSNAGTFPWASGSFQPSAEFNGFTNYFKALADGPDINERWLRDDLLAADGIGPEQLMFVGDDDNDYTFVHALILGSGQTARWRFGIDPLVGDDG
jgi:hypothetical protein